MQQSVVDWRVGRQNHREGQQRDAFPQNPFVADNLRHQQSNHGSTEQKIRHLQPRKRRGMRHAACGMRHGMHESHSNLVDSPQRFAENQSAIDYDHAFLMKICRLEQSSVNIMRYATGANCGESQIESFAQRSHED